MTRLAILLPGALALILCCAAKPRPAPCLRTGCSGELCASEPILSACIADPTFECYRQARCERQVDGGCAFTHTEQLASCLAQRDAGISAQ